MPSLNASLGAIELGILFSTMLLGLLIVQCYTYHQAEFKDGWLIRSLVILILILEAFHTVDVIIYMYYLTVKNFGDLTTLEHMHWSLGVSAPLTTLISCCVQSFFALRVYKLSSRMWYTLLVFALCLIRLGIAIANLVVLLPLTIADFVEKYGGLFITNACLVAAVDIGNTIAMCYWLIKAQREITTKRSRRVIDTLIRWSIETGLLTSIFVTMVLILTVASPGNFIWLGFYIVVPKLYSNSLMTSLNGRAGLRKLDRITQCHVSMSSLKAAPVEQKQSNDSGRSENESHAEATKSLRTEFV